MDEEDYRALIEVLSEELRMSGAADLADERHYVRPNEETGEAELMDPLKRLVEMLKAFERHVAIQDRAMYKLALQRIKDNLEGPAPEDAVVVLTQDKTIREVHLSGAPNLEDLRKDLETLSLSLLSPDLRPDIGGPR